MDLNYLFTTVDDTATTAETLKATFSDAEDIELLESLNDGAAETATMVAVLHFIEKEILQRNLLIPNEAIPLKERSDDWLAERRGELRKELSEVSDREKAFRQERNDIDQEFMDRFTARETSGTRTDRYTISCKQDDAYPEVEDRTDFENFVLETGKIHLLQKRLSLAAIKEELSEMERTRESLLEILDEEKWSEESCVDVLTTLFNETLDTVSDTSQHDGLKNGFDSKLSLIKKLGTLQDFTKDEIDSQYIIPGISLVTRMTINQVKRSK